MARIAELLAGEPREIDVLASGDLERWRLLFEALLKDRALQATPAFVAAAFDREPSFERWRQTAREAASKCAWGAFAIEAEAMAAFISWLYDGLARANAFESPPMLEARFSVLLTSAAEDGASQSRALVADARRAVGPGPLLAVFLLLAHRRLAEEGAHDEALAAVSEAEALFAGAGDARLRSSARRLRGGTLLELGRLTDGLALLDEALLEPSGMAFAGGGVFRVVHRGSARARAIGEAAAAATWVSPTDPEWVRALGVLAEAHGDPDLWRRFERALEALTEDAIEVVVDQADQRGMDEVARRARLSLAH